LRIAQANGFFDGIEDVISIDDQDMPTWLRVWSTMKVFYWYDSNFRQLAPISLPSGLIDCNSWFEIEPDSAFHVVVNLELDENLAVGACRITIALEILTRAWFPVSSPMVGRRVARALSTGSDP
jgi:hypothetical protein